MALLAGCAWGFVPPAPFDVSHVGANIQRTMTLLATSSPASRNNVCILIYGQSITRQSWVDTLGAWLKRTYPYANIDFRNLAIGGFTSDRLERISIHDVHTAHPDLVILYDYIWPDTPPFANYDSIVHRFRSQTGAEVALIDNHVREGDWLMRYDDESTVFLHSLAEKYGCEHFPLREQWKAYLAANMVGGNALLMDGTHLNDWGNYVMAELVKRFLRYDPAFPQAAWKDLATTFIVGKDIDFVSGKLTLPFNGSQIDLIAAGPPAPSSNMPVTVTVDGRKPSEFPECYVHTRPNGDAAGFPFSTAEMLRVTSASSSPRPEKWTVTLTKINTPYTDFDFKVSGSLTGVDGTGNSKADFVSNSRRVVIQARDWFLTDAKATSNTDFPAGTQIRFSTLPLCSDTYVAPAATQAAVENGTTVAIGLSNSSHTLVLTRTGSGASPISAIRVYRPFLDRAPVTAALARHPGAANAAAAKIPVYPRLRNALGKSTVPRTTP